MPDNGKDTPHQTFTAKFSAYGMADLHPFSHGNVSPSQMLALAAVLEHDAETITARALASNMQESELTVIFSSVGSSEFDVNATNVTANQILIFARWLAWRANLELNMGEAMRQQEMARNAQLAQKIIRAPKH